MRGKSILVCGAGDWVRKEYAPSLAVLRALRGCEITITYDSTYANRMPSVSGLQRNFYNNVIAHNIETFRAWGARCFDVARYTDIRELGSLMPDVVFVVTPPEMHCRVAEPWILRSTNVIVEKPFDVDPQAVLRLQERVSSADISVDVGAFDHYLQRANPLTIMLQHSWLAQFLEERIESWRFHMLERPEDEEVRRRFPSLQAGSIMDLCSHGIALLSLVGDVETVRPCRVRAGRYTSNQDLGIATSSREFMPGGMESFANVTFNFISTFGREATGELTVGKFVGCRSEKFLEIVGGRAGDRIVTFDFIRDSWRFEQAGVLKRYGALPGRSIARMISAVVQNDRQPDTGLMDLDTALHVTQALDAFREPIVMRVTSGRSLEEYMAGLRPDEITAALHDL